MLKQNLCSRGSNEFILILTDWAGRELSEHEAWECQTGGGGQTREAASRDVTEGPQRLAEGNTLGRSLSARIQFILHKLIVKCGSFIFFF